MQGHYFYERILNYEYDKINRTPIPKEPNKMTPQYYWSKIKAVCILNRISQKELSERLEISGHTMSTYNKNADNTKPETICRFCT